MQEEAENLQTLLDMQQNELSAVASTTDSIEARNLAILGADIAVLIYIGQAGFDLATWQGVVLLTPFIISLGCCLYAIVPSLHSKYVGNIDLAQHPEYLTYARQDLLLQLLSNLQAAIDNNNRLNRRRTIACMVAMWLAVLGVLILFATIKLWVK